MMLRPIWVKLKVSTCLSHLLLQRTVSFATSTPHSVVTNNGGLWLSMTRWNPCIVPDTNGLTNGLSSCHSHEDILEFVDKREHWDKLKQNPDLLTVVFRTLIFKRLVLIEQQYPFKAFLQRDIYIAIKQLRSSQKHFDIVFGPILQHPTFKCLIDIVDEHKDKLTASCVQELRFLVNILYKSPTEPLLRQLYLLARHNLSASNWFGVSLFLNSSVRQDFKANGIILNRLKRDMTNSVKGWDEREILSCLRICENLRSYFSEDLWDVVTAETAQIYSLTGINSDAYFLGILATVMSKLYDNANKPLKNKIVFEQCFINLTKMVFEWDNPLESLELWLIQRAVVKMFKNRDFMKPAVIRSQALDRLHEDIEPKDLLNISQTILLLKDRDAIELWSRLFCAKLCSIELLSRDYGYDITIALILVVMKWLTPEMKQVLSQWAVAHALQYKTPPSYYPRFIHKFISHRDIESLMRDMENKAALSVLNYNFASYMGTVVQFSMSMSEQHFLRLVRTMGNSNAIGVKRMAFGLYHANMVDVHLDGAKALRLLTLHACCQSRIAHCLKRHQYHAVENLYFVNIAVGKYYLSFDKGFDDMVISSGTDIATHHALTHELLDKLVLECARTCRFSAPLLDVYIRSVIAVASMRDVFDLQLERKLMILVRVCGRFYYRPEQLGVLLDYVMAFYDKKRAQKDYMACVRILHGLVQINIFPKQQLIDLFRVETIADIVRFCQPLSPGLVDMVKNVVAIVNRSVVIDCAQFNIQWFCQGVLLTKFRSSNAVFTDLDELHPSVGVETITGTLETMFGGKRFVKCGAVSEFDYIIHAVIAFNEHGDAVPINDTSYTPTGKENKVAVLLATQLDSNGVRMMGPMELRKRHLEKLGYRVILIHKGDWWSMGLKDPRAKLNYMYTKIFGAHKAKQCNKYHVAADREIGTRPYASIIL